MVRKEDIYYDSRDNRTKVHAISWVPQKGEIKGILQIVHGMAEQIEDYEKFAEFMGEKGFIVVGNDHLGHGETVNAEKGKGYFCAKDGATVLVRDVHRLKKMIQNAYPGRAYIILGYGMGSLIVQKYIMEYGKGIDGAILMGTCRKSDSFLGREGLRLKFLTKLRGDNYRSEWMKKRVYMPCEESSFSISLNAYNTVLEMMDYIQQRENYENVRKNLPIFLVSGEKDPVGDNGNSVKEFYKMYLELGYKDVEMKLYPQQAHELLRGTDREPIYENVAQWISKIVQQCAEE